MAKSFQLETPPPPPLLTPRGVFSFIPPARSRRRKARYRHGRAAGSQRCRCCCSLTCPQPCYLGARVWHELVSGSCSELLLVPPCKCRDLPQSLLTSASPHL